MTIPVATIAGLEVAVIALLGTIEHTITAVLYWLAELTRLSTAVTGFDLASARATVC
jgi:hypothetical protein